MNGSTGSIGGAATIAAALAIAAAVALWQGPDTPARRQAIVLAAAAVGAGAVGAWLVLRWSSRRAASAAVAGALGSTLIRLAPGLMLLAWIATSGGSIREAGAAGLVVVFYLVTLGTLLILQVAAARKVHADRQDRRTN